MNKKISPVKRSSILKDIARIILHKERGDKIPMLLLKFEVKCLIYDNAWSNCSTYYDTYYHADSYMENIESILYDLLAGREPINEIYHIKLDVYSENNEFFNWHEFMIHLEERNCVLLDDNNIGHHRNIHIGDVVRHFKYNTLNRTEKTMNRYTYKVLGFAQHTETGEPMVVYEALYDTFRIYVRPYKMFMSVIDYEKYPDTGQVFRFYKVPTTLT